MSQLIIVQPNYTANIRIELIKIDQNVKVKVFEINFCLTGAFINI